MSGFLGVLAASGDGGGGINPAFTAAPNNVSTVSGLRSASLTLSSDGTTTASNDTPVNWALTAYTGVGSGWFVKFTVSGSNVTVISGTTGSYLSLSSGRSITFQNSSSSVEGIGTLTMDFSRDGVNSVATKTADIAVGYAP